MSKAYVKVHVSVAQGGFIISLPSPNGLLTHMYTKLGVLAWFLALTWLHDQPFP